MLVPLVILRLIWSCLRNPDYWSRWPERFGYCPGLDEARPVLWIHAVSVGEAHAARPLIARLLNEYPHCQVLVTTMTPTGARTVRQSFMDAVSHRYIPYDLPGAVRRFLERIRPRLCLVMETELWPNLFHGCRSRAIPVVLANARMSEKSRRGYACLPGLVRSTLADVSLIAARGRPDADRFLGLGAEAERIVVTGNLKFDIRIPRSLIEQAESLRRDLSVNRPVWIAASTHEGEEKPVLDAFFRVLARHKDCLLIIAPRHPERFGAVADLCLRAGARTARRSRGVAEFAAVQVLVLDTLGELPLYYAASDIAFVGGSLVPTGGHNMLEPASLGVPVITGPHVCNFSEISDQLKRSGAAWTVADSRELADTVCELLGDANLRHQAGESGKRLVEENRGGIDRLMHSLQPYLSQDATFGASGI